MKRDKNDAAWSKAIRERAGYNCERCGAWHLSNSRGLHAAHIFTRAIKKTRHDMANGVALCYGCHSHFHRNPLEFHEWARKKLGKRKYEALQARAKRIASVREGGQILKGKAKPSRVFAAPDGLAREAAALPLVRERLTGIEAAAKVAYHLSMGEPMSPALVAGMTGLSRQHSQRLLCAMSRVIPIYRDGGRWHICPREDRVA